MKQEFICLITRDLSCEFRRDAYSYGGACTLRERAKYGSCIYAVKSMIPDPEPEIEPDKEDK